MVRKLSTKNIIINETPERRNVKVLFGDNAIVAVLEFIEKTELRRSAEGQRRKLPKLILGLLSDWTERNTKKEG